MISAPIGLGRDGTDAGGRNERRGRCPGAVRRGCLQKEDCWKKGSESGEGKGVGPCMRRMAESANRGMRMAMRCAHTVLESLVCSSGTELVQYRSLQRMVDMHVSREGANPPKSCTPDPHATQPRSTAPATSVPFRDTTTTHSVSYHRLPHPPILHTPNSPRSPHLRCAFRLPFPPPLPQPHCTRHRLLFLYHIIRAPLHSCSVSLRRTPLSSIILPTSCCRRRCLSDTSTAALSAFSHHRAPARTQHPPLADSRCAWIALSYFSFGTRPVFFISLPPPFFCLSFSLLIRPRLLTSSGFQVSGAKPKRKHLHQTTANDTNVAPLFKLGRELCFCASIRASCVASPYTFIAAPSSQPLPAPASAVRLLYGCRRPRALRSLRDSVAVSLL